MPSSLIFITGATGFIGSVTAHEAVKAGYRLRVSVRRESQIEKLKKFLSDYVDQLEFVVISDFTHESSFAGKLDGVDYVLHMASPLASPGPDSTNKEKYFKPAVNGTVAILKEAAKVPTIKRVVITSSIFALVPMSGVPGGEVLRENHTWDLSVDTTADFTGPNDFVTAMNMYHASKLLADNASWEYKKTASPPYSLVTIHPSFVFGHNPLQTTAEEAENGTNGLLFATIMTGKPVVSPLSVHVRDVAEAHIKALDDKVPDGSKYLLASGKYTWGDVVALLKKRYPTSGFGLTGDTPGPAWPVDTTKAETELGMKWRSYEEQVIDVMDQQLSFRKA